MTTQSSPSSTFKRLCAYPLARRKEMLQGLGLLLIASLATAGGPWLIQHFIDEYIAKNEYPTQVLLVMLLSYIGLQLCSGVFQYLQGLHFNIIATEIVKTIRKQVFNSVIEQPLAQFDYTPTGKLVSRITNDTESLQQFYQLMIATVIRNVVMIAVMLVIMFIMSWQLTLVVIALLPVIVGLMLLFKHLSTDAYRQMRDLTTDINSNLSESIQGMSVVQLMRQEKRFRQTFADLNQSHLDATKRVVLLNGIMLRPLMDLLAGLALVALVTIFGFNGVGAIGVGVLYAFISYLGRLTEPLIEITQQLALLQQALVASERLFELIDQPSQRYGNDERPLHSGKIDVNQLTFSYDGQKNVLEEIKLTIPHKSFTALVGHTGSGKSTLASLLMGFYPCDENSLLVDGRPLSSLSKSVVRRDIAMVQQDPHILPASIRDNITLGRAISDAEIYHALEKVGLKQQVMHYPKQLDTQLGQGETNLSAGQKQLLAMARVMVDKPKILILDEATANIDSGTEALLQRSLNAIRHDMTLIVIAHRLSTILDADQIVVLHHGELVEQGKHTELLRKQGRYAQMYQLQQADQHLQALVQKESDSAVSPTT